MRLLEFPDTTVIDLYKVVSVSPIDDCSYPEWPSYEVMLEGNVTIKVFEKRRYGITGKLERAMPRAQFIGKWQQYCSEGDRQPSDSVRNPFLEVGGTVELTEACCQELGEELGRRFRVLEIKSDRSACLLDRAVNPWVLMECLIDVTHYGA